jgi:hypothetical protein
MLKITHHAGFFSCCTGHLEHIVNYFNKEKNVPNMIDSTEQFKLYKPALKKNQDIKSDYFDTTSEIISYESEVYFTKENDELQFSEYSKLEFDKINPFIRKYFTPSQEIIKIICQIEEKYEIKYDNLCAIFYRGNDKEIETVLPSYDEFIQKAKDIKEKNPEIIFLIQSDETEFLVEMKNAFPSSIVFYDEIRHVPKKVITVDNLQSADLNYFYSKLFLAIIIILSKCKYVITTTGNCSLWISFFRGNANGIQQFLSRKKIIWGTVNPYYKESENSWMGKM